MLLLCELARSINLTKGKSSECKDPPKRLLGGCPVHIIMYSLVLVWFLYLLEDQ